MPELRGGAPAISSYVNLDFVKDSSSFAYIDSGSSNFSHRGQLLSLDGQQTLKFNGRDAWQSPVKLTGSLEFLIKPLSSNSEVEVFLREQRRSVKFFKTREVTEEQFQLNILQWDTRNYHNDLQTFGSSIGGINNLSRFAGYNLVSSLPYFFKGRSF